MVAKEKHAKVLECPAWSAILRDAFASFAFCS